MSGYISAVNLFDGATAGAGVDPTVAYTTTTGTVAAQRCAEFNTLTLHARLVSGTAPASLEVIVEGSNDGGTTWAPITTKATGAGLVTLTPAVFSLTWAPIDSETAESFGGLDIKEERVRLKCKRTGGDGTTRVLISALFAVA